jgi:hypothetical protein
VSKTEPEWANENAASVTQTQEAIDLETEEKEENGRRIRCQKGVKFNKTKLKTPLKRKLHPVEVHANQILKKIKENNPKDAKQLEKAPNSQPDDATQKYCTQSREEGESFLKTYGNELPNPPCLMAERRKGKGGIH